MRPSAYIRSVITGSGTGFELDDLVSRFEGDRRFQDVVDQIAAMMARHQDQGLTSQLAKAELAVLADALEQEGR